MYDGQVWKDFLHFQNAPFLADTNTIGLMINIDWFQPFKHRTYSIGVVYLVIMNLPRSIRYKRENIIIIGLLPGPSEPPKTINTYLAPLVSELLTLWKGYTFKIASNKKVLFRCALLCVACDLPAGRKVRGFLSYVANLGCSRCYYHFGTGTFGKQNFSGFNRDSWVYRSMDKHRKDVELTLKCSSKTAQERKESEVGCRYSCLLQLPYFDAIRMLIIDPMHNLYLGTAKNMLRIWRNSGIIDKDALRVINDRISQLNVPSNGSFSRLPSSIESRAEQWMVWVNYYSLYCLYEQLPSDHFECWRHFVLASRLMSRRSVSKDDTMLADAFLLQFCWHFQTSYGPDAVTPNMHLHCHLADCVRDFGPMASFWLFSFERFNGLLGDQPTNNRSIEVQLMQRFTDDNARLQLIEFAPSNCESSDVNSLFQHAIVDHAHSFYSVNHLDTTLSRANHFSSGFQYVPAGKYTSAAFSQLQLEVLSRIYGIIYPSIPPVCLPQSYRKMLSVTINEQQFCAGQYVLAKGMFSFAISSEATRTVFSDPSLCPAKIHHFAIHSFHANDSTLVTHGFAIVSWPLQHPLLSTFGKLYQVWCSSVYDIRSDNCIIPLENISSLLLTVHYDIKEETVLVTVPVLL